MSTTGNENCGGCCPNGSAACCKCMRQIGRVPLQTTRTNHINRKSVLERCYCGSGGDAGGGSRCTVPYEAGAVPPRERFPGGGSRRRLASKRWQAAAQSEKWSAISVPRKLACPLLHSTRKDRRFRCIRLSNAAALVPPREKGFDCWTEGTQVGNVGTRVALDGGLTLELWLIHPQP